MPGAPEEVLRMKATVLPDEAIAAIRNLGKELGMTGRNVNMKPVTAQFEGLRGTIRNLAKEIGNVGGPAFSSLGFEAAGAGISIYAFARAMRETSDRIQGLKNASGDLGFSIRQLQAFQTSADKAAGMTPDAALSGLAQFQRNAEDFKLRIGELRDRLKDLGAGDVVERIAAAATPLEGLRVAFERMQALERSNPALARRFAQDMFGNAEFARLGWRQFLDEVERTAPITQKQIDDAHKMRDAFIDLATVWGDLQTKVSLGLAPAMTKELADVQAILRAIGKAGDWIDERLGLSGDDGKGDALGRAAGSLMRGKKPSERYFERLEKENQQGPQQPPTLWQNLMRNNLPGIHRSSFDRDTTKDATKAGVVEGLIQYAALVQGGAGGGIINASFNPGGGEGGQRGGVGFRSGGGFHVLSNKAGRRALGRKLGLDRSSLGRDIGDVGTGAMDRSDFAAEIKANPELAERLQTIVQGEVGHGASTQRQMVQLETIFNRARARGQSLDAVTQMYTGPGSKGYYPPSTFSGGRIRSQAELDRFQKDIMAPVVAGSDQSTRLLGFPATGNASGGVAARGVSSGRYTRHGMLGPETYVQEGSRRENIDRLEASRRIDGTLGGDHTMTATGTVNVNVHAPKGTKVATDANGLWQATTVKNYRQMAPTESPGW